MPIKFHEGSKTFHIYNKHLSYITCIMENGQMENLYYGKAIRDKEDFSYLHEEIMRSLMAVCVPEPGLLSMQYTKQEYPVYGTGDYRNPALTVRQENGSEIVDFKYVSHEIYGGKKKLAGLPATYTENEEEATSLDITLHDSVMDTDLVLTYSVYEDYPVVTRSARLVQKGNQKIRLENVMSAAVEFPDMDYEMIHLSGAWARERYVKTRKLEMGIQAVQSLAGTGSSSEQNPFIALKRPHTTEDTGEVFGFSFVYSGNFLAKVEVSTYEMTRVMMGINPQGFSWELSRDEEFQTPEVVMVYSDKGLNGMSQAYHRLYRDRLMRGKWRNHARPILLNNWEATYFDFDEEKIRQAVAGFVGEQKQIPPMYSAIKVNGKKLYELAREGKEIERKARTITIFAINIVRFLPPDRFEIDVDCSKGTYIRTLCSDIGKALGCGAHMAELTRTRTGSFALEDAITLGELQTMADEGRQEEAFLSMEAALSDFPKIIVSPKSTKMLYNGGRVYAKFYEVEKELTAGDIAAVSDSEHHLVGLYEVRDEEGFYIKPFKMLI